MANLITDAIGALKGGTAKGQESSVGIEGTSTDDAGNPYHDVEVVTDSSSVNSFDSVDESEETSSPKDDESGAGSKDSDTSGKDSAASAAKAQTSKTADPNKETITITDDQGKRKLEIDYSDRAAIRKAHEMAALARKTQAERDRERTEKTQLSEQRAADRKVIDALEKAFAERGEDGVIDLIAGKPGASAEYIQRRIDRAKFLEKASPAEKAQLEQKERLEQLERELEKQRTENVDREKRIVTERETAELRATESTVHPVFEKYRFDGKLGAGAEEDEAMFDEMLWNTALKRLKPYEDQRVPMTKELVDREFRTVATQLRKRINMQAEKKAAAVVEQRKQEATENAQASTVSAYKRGGLSEERNKFLDKGDFAGLFRSFGNKRK